MKILLLGDNLANTNQWISGMEKYTHAEVVRWGFTSTGRISRTLEWLRALTSIRKEIKRINPDVIIGYRITSYGFLAAWSGFKPCVIAAQGHTDVWPQNHWSTPFKAALARYAIRRADMIHCWGEHMAENIMEYGGEREKILVLPRGVDLKLFNRREPRTIDAAQTVTFGVTRSLAPEYNHLVILQAFKKLVDDGKRVKMIIAGRGPEEENIRNYIKENGLEQLVSMEGFVQNQDLPGLLNRCHFYLSMVNTEGVSASLFEAMACGCFPVISDLPANRSFIENGRNGFLVPYDDAGQLYSKINEVLNNPSLFENGCNQNLKLVSEVADIEKNMKKFVEEYSKLVKK